jgi:adenine/guanine phosphoribosyltransferase-like PRPP-binding protein
MKKMVKKNIVRVQGLKDERSLLDRCMLATYYAYRDLKARFADSEDDLSSRLYLRSRGLKRNLAGKRFKFVSVDQASIWTLDWVKTFPVSFDLIVGVPRSGMFIASLIALKLGKGLTTPELLQRGQYWHSSVVNDRLPLDKDTHVLLVDDAVYSGNSMATAVKAIRSTNKDIRISKASLIIDKASKDKVDYYHKFVEPPRVYEFGNGVLAVDLDGVLCGDCPQNVDEDEKLYIEWLSNARPYLIPSFEIDAVVTSRLERYRNLTEEWLKKHRVRYRSLHMWDIDSKTQRHGNFGAYKIKKLLHLKPDMYWESNWSLSKEIWEETRIPTLCIDRMTLLS